MPLRVLLNAALSSLVAGLVAASTSAGAAPAGPLAARSQLDCFAEVPGVTAKGVPTTLRYEDGKAAPENRGPDDLGYQPRDVAFAHRPPASGRLLARATVESYWFTVSGSELREVVEVDKRTASGLLVSAAYQTRVVRKNWDDVRQISIGEDRDHLYVLTNDAQMLRYRLSGKDGNASTRSVVTVGTAFGTVGTLEYSRTVGAGSQRADVFLASDADTGALFEISVPLDNPAAYSTTVLVPTGWTDMRSVGRTASCINPRSGRSYDGIVGVDLDGGVRMWTDRHGDDGDGTDIVNRGLLKTSWRPMPYSD